MNQQQNSLVRWKECNSVQQVQKSEALPSLFSLATKQSLKAQLELSDVIEQTFLELKKLRNRYAYFKALLNHYESLNFSDVPATAGLTFLNAYLFCQQELQATEAQGKAIRSQLDLEKENTPLHLFEKAEAELMVATLVLQFQQLMSLGERGQSFDLEAMSSIVVEKFGSLSIAQIASVLAGAVAGEETVYGNLTIPTICQWLNKFKKQVTSAYAGYSYDKHLQHKSDTDYSRGYELLEARRIRREQGRKMDKARDEANHKIEVERRLKERQEQGKR